MLMLHDSQATLLMNIFYRLRRNISVYPLPPLSGRISKRLVNLLQPLMFQAQLAHPLPPQRSSQTFLPQAQLLRTSNPLPVTAPPPSPLRSSCQSLSYFSSSPATSSGAGDSAPHNRTSPICNPVLLPTHPKTHPYPQPRPPPPPLLHTPNSAPSTSKQRVPRSTNYTRLFCYKSSQPNISAVLKQEPPSPAPLPQCPAGARTRGSRWRQLQCMWLRLRRGNRLRG